MIHKTIAITVGLAIVLGTISCVLPASAYAAGSSGTSGATGGAGGNGPGASCNNSGAPTFSTGGGGSGGYHCPGAGGNSFSSPPPIQHGGSGGNSNNLAGGYNPTQGGSGGGGLGRSGAAPGTGGIGAPCDFFGQGICTGGAGGKPG